MVYLGKGNIWPNLRIINGLSRDMASNFISRTKPRGALVMNDPGYAMTLAQQGLIVIYRQSGDDPDSNPLRLSPDQFIRDRIHPGFENYRNQIIIHTTNEVGPSVDVDKFNKECSDYLHSSGINFRGCLFNHSSNKYESQWAIHRDTIATAVARSDWIGFHLYDDLKEDHQAGAYGWRKLYNELRGRWACTEIAYIRDLTDAYHGHRNYLPDSLHAALWTRHSAYFAPLGIPLCAYSLENWPVSDDGNQNGFGYLDNEPITKHFEFLNVTYLFLEVPVNIEPVPAEPVGAGVNSTLGLSDMNFRSAPGRQATKLSSPKPKGTNLIFYPESKYPSQGLFDGYIWYQVSINGKLGWMAWIQDSAPKITDQFIPIVSGFRFRAPFKNSKIISHFNAPRPYYTHFGSNVLLLHEGIDFIDDNASLYGTDPIVHVGAPGKVVQVGYQADGYGHFVRVDHGNNYVSWYCHLADDGVYVQVGQVLKDWQIVGLMGDTGSSSEPHVHVTVQRIGAGLPNYVVADVVNFESLLY